MSELPANHAAQYAIAIAPYAGYYRNNPGQGYCQVVISPKLAKLRAGHAALLRA